MIMMKFSDRQLLLCVQVCFLEEILEFHGRLGGWSMSIARWPMADILVQRLKLELRVLDNGYAAADYFWMGSLSSRLDQGDQRRYEMYAYLGRMPRCFQGVQYWGITRRHSTCLISRVRGHYCRQIVVVIYGSARISDSRVN